MTTISIMGGGAAHSKIQENRFSTLEKLAHQAYLAIVPVHQQPQACAIQVYCEDGQQQPSKAQRKHAATLAKRCRGLGFSVQILRILTL